MAPFDTQNKGLTNCAKMTGFGTELKRTGLGPQAFPQDQRHFAAFGHRRQKPAIGPHFRQQKISAFPIA